MNTVNGIISTNNLKNVPAMIASSGYATSHRRADMNILTHKQSGVYAIVNKLNGKMYIGSSVDLHKRERQHFRELSNGTHRNRYLQRSFNKHGKDAFEFNVLICCSRETLLSHEQNLIDNLKPEYNIYKTAGSPQGYTHPEEVRKKISTALLGNSYSAKKHVPHSDETKRKMALAHQMSNAMKANLEKLHAARVGKPLSMETRMRISESHKGKQASEETRQKMSEARKAYLRRRNNGNK